VEFEFDSDKSAANLAKHGIDFAEAQVLWQDPMYVEVPARTTDEPRWLVIGQIKRQTLVGSGDLPAAADQDHLGPPLSGRGGNYL
jgi:uncharacterized DUF497 family protein